MKQEADHRFNGKKNTNINPRTHMRSLVRTCSVTLKKHFPNVKHYRTALNQRELVKWL